MENQLIKGLPQTITINGNEYAVNTDFRDWMAFDAILNDKNIDVEIQFYAISTTLLKDTVDNKDLKGLVNALFSFYLLGREIPKASKNDKNIGPVYNFIQDWSYIYSAFKQQYNVDLFTTDLHWYQFKSMLDNISDATMMGKIIGWRAIDLSEIKDFEQRSRYQELKERYALLVDKQPTRSAEEIRKELLAKVGGGNDGIR